MLVCKKKCICLYTDTQRNQTGKCVCSKTCRGARGRTSKLGYAAVKWVMRKLHRILCVGILPLRGLLKAHHCPESVTKISLLKLKVA